MNPTLISYYTGDDYYHRCSKNLKSSCDHLGIPIIIENINNLGSYWKNTLIKPSYILDKMNYLKSDIIWIDVDTNLLKYPDCFKKWDSDILLASHTGELDGIKASPIGIRYNERTISLLSRWTDICNSNIESNNVDLDHDILKYELLPSMKGYVSIEIMNDSGTSPSDFTNGNIIDNGVSRVSNKAKEMKIVIEKNKFRCDIFNMLNLNDFKNIR